MNISLQTLINIANVLDIDINYLLSNDDTTDSKDKNTDVFLESLIKNLSMRDKAFIIHTINGLKAYNAEGEKYSVDN